MILFGSIPTGTQEGGREVILHRLRNPLGIQRKVAKALAMGDEVRADDGHCLGIDALPFCRELGQDLGQVHDVMKDHQIANERIVLDDLALGVRSLNHLFFLVRAISPDQGTVNFISV